MSILTGKLHALLLILVPGILLASTSTETSIFDQTTIAIVTKSASELELSLTAPDITFTIESIEGQLYTIPTDLQYHSELRGKIPSTSRWIVIPANKNVVLSSNVSTWSVSDNAAPLYYDRESLGSSWDEADIYPSAPVVMSEPVVLRGVRMVKLTYYPLQYDRRSGSLIKNDRVEADLEFKDGQPINPVKSLLRTNLSRNFGNVMDALSINRDDPMRDEHRLSPFAGHLLIVTHAGCLPYVIDYIEWKRQSGYLVDVISLDEDDALDEDLIADLIQDAYDSYLNAGVDPFDYLLLIGDRYDPDVGSEWMLDAPRGESGVTPKHDDYYYGLLEGNDYIPDVAIGRMTAGNEDMIELAIGRTLVHEKSPWMEDTDWFKTAGAFSESWPPDQNDLSLPFAVRWSEQRLRLMGYDNILVAEHLTSNEIGSELTDWYNDGVSLMVGRAELSYWQHNFAGIETNTVFPIFLNFASHAELMLTNAFQTGSGNDLKGPAAIASGWGVSTTLSANGMWLTFMRGALNFDMPLGWARTYAGIDFRLMFPEYDEQTARNMQSKLDLYGDPTIQPWIGVPMMVELDHSRSVTPNQTIYRIGVADPDGKPLSGARVTFYQSGEMPEEEDYTDWEPHLFRTTMTDRDGMAHLIIDKPLAEDNAIITVTGRNIYPAIEEVEVAAEEVTVDLVDVTIEDVEGLQVTAGNSFEFRLKAINSGSQSTAEEVEAVLWTNFPGIGISDDFIAYGNIEPGESDPGVGLIEVSFPSWIDNQMRIPMNVTFHSGETRWESVFEVVVQNIDLLIEPVEFSAETDLTLDIINQSTIDLPASSYRLERAGWGVSIVDGVGDMNEITAMETVEVTPGFTIAPDTTAGAGIKAPLWLIRLGENDAEVDTYKVLTTVTGAEVSDPQGPDPYGYYAYDNTDDEDWLIWSIGRFRNYWLEIDTESDPRYEGTVLQFAQNYNSSQIIPLPFSLKFYGEKYDTLTVCINGFVGVGSQSRYVNYQDSPMELGVGGSAGMIAPLWDALKVGDETRISFAYAVEEHALVIEWKDVETVDGAATLTFQVLIFDENFYPTLTGDNVIAFLYDSASPVAGRAVDRTYASIGISSPDGRSGLSYTFANEYPPTSNTISSGLSIEFSTTPPYVHGKSFGKVVNVNSYMSRPDIANAEVTALAPFGFQHDAWSNFVGADSIEKPGFQMIGLRGLDALNFHVDRPGLVLKDVQVDSITYNFGMPGQFFTIFMERDELFVTRDQIMDSLQADFSPTRYTRIYNRTDEDFNFATLSKLTPDGDWISISHADGSVAAGENLELGLEINTDGLEYGDYMAEFLLKDEATGKAVVFNYYLNLDSSNETVLDESGPPMGWQLGQNYPNPFNGGTRIDYSLAQIADVTLSIYDLSGRLIEAHELSRQTSGMHSFELNLDHLPSGLYVYRMKAGEFKAARKLLLMK
ncbi:C25 family cysteine peptidase [Calditrichota bacterium]